jgi:hypothetical protein
MNETGGTQGVFKGNLKRRLCSCVIAQVSPGEVGSGPFTVTALLRGLSSVLNVFVGVGGYQMTDDDNIVPIPPSVWPAGAGTIQMIPQSNFPDGGAKCQFRPVFQDPTFSDNANHPLPQELPFSWNFPGEADEAVIEITIDRDVFQGTGLSFSIELQVMVEYFGPWWDAEAFKLAMGQVSITPPTNKPIVVSS